jgi:hypothetical protein
MRHIQDKYFQNTLEKEKLSKEEYDYYYNHLIVADTNIFPSKIIYFDNQKYIFIGGECLKEYNRLNGLIKNTFSINTYKVLFIGDNILENSQKIFPEKSIIFTNLMTESILSKKISLVCKFDLLNLSLIANTDKIYQDLIGTIESQGLKSFFPNERIKKPFQESLANIDPRKRDIFPSELIALIHWFKQCNIS